MTTSTGANLYTLGGANAPSSSLINAVISNVSPTTTNLIGPNGPFKVGQRWVNSSAGQTYTLTSIATSAGVTSATWILEGSGGSTGAVNTLTGDSGTATPSSGNIKIAGTSQQITTAGSGSTVTLSIPTTFLAPGSIASTSGIVAATTIHATLGNITLDNGSLVLGTAGNKILSTSVATTTTAGANSFGSVALSGGTATISTTAVTANSLIFIWRQSVGSTGNAALGELSVGTIVASTSFVINAWEVTSATTLQSTDVSVVGWMIVN